MCPQPIVKTSYGYISDTTEEGVFSFKGIPYAKAERFMPTRAPDTWEGVRDHSKFGPIAMQVNSWSPESAMDEQKLFTVDVWTQGLNDGKKRPFMFWLHGGGFAVGASDDPITDGKMLAQKGDIVLVSVNHRLNILGFLDLSALGDKYAHSANVGMLDVVAALLLTWKSTVDGNTRGSFHGLDIPLAFKNIQPGKHWTGTSDEAQALAEKMSSVWINFARTGNPNAEGSIPTWKPYSRENGETMIFDKEPKILSNHDRELMQLIKSVR